MSLSLKLVSFLQKFRYSLFLHKLASELSFKFYVLDFKTPKWEYSVIAMMDLGWHSLRSNTLDPVNHLESVWEYLNAQLVKTRAWIPALSMLGRIVLGQIQTKFENCLGLGWVCYSCENPLAETQKLLLFSRQQWFIQISSGLEKKLNTCWVRIQLDYHPRRLGQIQTKKW